MTGLKDPAILARGSDTSEWEMEETKMSQGRTSAGRWWIYVEDRDHGVGVVLRAFPVYS